MKISTAILFMMQGAVLGACGGTSPAPTQTAPETQPAPPEAPPAEAPPSGEEPPANPIEDSDAGVPPGPSHEDGCPACGRG